MNKLLTKVARLALGLSLAAGVGVAIGSKAAERVDAASVTYTLSNKNAISATAAFPFGVSYSGTYSWNSPQLRFTSTDGVVTFTGNSSVAAITEIQIGCSSAAYAPAGSATSGYTTSVSSSTVIISGSGSSSVVWTLGAAGRLKTYQITYTENSTSYTVSYNVGTGASGTIANSTGTTITLKTWSDISSSVTPPSGKVFVGWNTAANGSGTSYAGGATVTANLTLYAQWFTPYSVASARSAIDSGSGVTNVAAKGIVSSIVTAYNANYKNISFDLSDDGTTTTDQLRAYRTSSVSDPDIQVGDIVTIAGSLTKYNSTYEFAEGNTIVIHSELNLLSVTTPPTKTSYNSGDSFAAAGLVVTASYTDESDKSFAYNDDATNFVLSPANGASLTTANTSVSIGYGRGSTSQSITVAAAPNVLSVSVNPSTKGLSFGEEFTITATVSVEGGASQNVSWSIEDSSTLVSIKSSTTSSAVIKANNSVTGTVLVTATSTVDATKKASCTIRVADPNALTDTLTYGLIGITGTSYSSWSSVTDATAATYSGVTAGGNTSIQLNNNTKGGIYNTTSAGYVRTIEVTFEAHTSADRSVLVYGFSSPISSISEITGTEIGSATYDGTNATCTINISSLYEYEYFGITGSGALYLEEIVITYEHIDTSPSIQIIGNSSVTGLEGSSDSTSTSIKVKNIASPVFTFTFDEDGDTDLLTSSYISVSVGSLTDGVYPLTIDFDNAGTTTINVNVSGQTATINVTVVGVSYVSANLPSQYRQVLDDSELVAGDKILIADNNTDDTKDKIMNSTLNNYFGASEVTFTNSCILVADKTDGIELTLGGDATNGWTLQDSSENYITANSSKNFVRGNSSGTWSISIEDGNAIITYSNSDYGYILHNVSQPRFKPYTSSPNASMRYPQIYKLISGNKQVAVGSDLFGAISSAESAFTCDSSGETFNVSNFNSMASYFNANLISKYYLDYADSKDALDGGNEIENFLARYDYVLGKKAAGYSAYASAEDFLGRVASGKISGARIGVNSLLTSTNTNTIAIIVIISMVSVTAIGGYFFIKRRKIN